MGGRQIRLLDDSEWPASAFGVRLPISRERAALGIIDMQHYCIGAREHLAQTVQRHSRELHEEYAKRVERVIGNIGNLLSVFRASKRRVFYTRHGIQLPDAGDLVVRRRNREQRALAATGGTSGHLAVRGTPGYEIIPELAPLPNELVFDKNTSSAFHSTPIDLFLRNMNADTVILTGIASDQCVFATALDAADRGFHVIIASDACASLDPGSAEAVQILFGRVFGYVMRTPAIIDWLETGAEPRETRITT
jgi:nicotinamidase-related amidase